MNSFLSETLALLIFCIEKLSTIVHYLNQVDYPDFFLIVLSWKVGVVFGEERAGRKITRSYACTYVCITVSSLK